MEWIRVSYRPDNRQRVLIVPNVVQRKVVSATYVEHYENEHANFGAVFIGDDAGFYRLDSVSYWMPLPECPEI